MIIQNLTKTSVQPGSTGICECVKRLPVIGEEGSSLTCQPHTMRAIRPSEVHQLAVNNLKIMAMLSTGRDFQSFAGPGDRDLPMSEIQGYQPVSRIGEVVMNAFVDSNEFAVLADHLTGREVNAFVGGNNIDDVNYQNEPAEYKPMFHEWATVQPGMVCLARKKKTAVFRQYVAAETAVPVIACAACLPQVNEKDFFFAGVARSKSVRGPDDGMGPSVDEFFTVSIGGMVTLLNTSGVAISNGDLIEWCFISPKAMNQKAMKRLKTGPRRVGVKVGSVSSPKIIGRALSFSKPGETFDLLLYALRPTTHVPHRCHAPPAVSHPPVCVCAAGSSEGGVSVIYIDNIFENALVSYKAQLHNGVMCQTFQSREHQFALV